MSKGFSRAFLFTVAVVSRRVNSLYLPFARCFLMRLFSLVPVCLSVASSAQESVRSVPQLPPVGVGVSVSRPALAVLSGGQETLPEGERGDTAFLFFPNCSHLGLRSTRIWGRKQGSNLVFFHRANHSSQAVRAAVMGHHGLVAHKQQIYFSQF